MRPISGSQEPLQKRKIESKSKLNMGLYFTRLKLYIETGQFWSLGCSGRRIDRYLITSLWLQASWSYESWLMTMCPTILTSPSWKPCNKSRRLNYHLIMTERAGSNILCWSYNGNDIKRTFSPFGADGNKCKGACTDRCRLDKAGNIEIFIVVIVCTTRVHKCVK